MASPLQAAFIAWLQKTFPEQEYLEESRWHRLSEEFRELSYARELLQQEGEHTQDLVDDLKGELADVYLCLLGFSQAWGIDLEKVAAEKLRFLGSQVYEFSPERGWVRVGG